MTALSQQLALPLALAAFAEVLLLRTLMRAGPFLPRAEWLADVYRGMQLVGTAAANLVTLLAVTTILLLAAKAFVGDQPIGRLAGLVALTTAGLQAYLVLVPAASLLAAVGVLALTALALSLILAASPLRGLARLGAATILVTDFAALYHAIAQPARALGLDLPGATAPFFAAEGLATVAVIGVLSIVRPGFQWGPAIAGLAAGSLVAVGRTLQPSIFALATMWNFGFTLYLPTVIYALTAGLFTYTLVTLGRSADARRTTACGLTLIALGGLKLDYGYFALMALAGYWLLTADVRAATGRRTSPPGRRS
ncbi:MAG: hypothetical protein HYY04_13560 [Chloroflexi bacterium]|nr:hypothetical protein [Chloroflexota bacterium]